MCMGALGKKQHSTKKKVILVVTSGCCSSVLHRVPTKYRGSSFGLDEKKGQRQTRGAPRKGLASVLSYS